MHRSIDDLPMIGIRSQMGFHARLGLNRILEVVTAVAMCGVLVKYFQHWPRFWDVLLWDETNHLGAGVFDWFGPPRSYEGQALYALFYKALAQIWPDTLELFFIVALIGVVAATAAIFV